MQPTPAPKPGQLTPQQVQQMQLIVKQALSHLLEGDNAKFLVTKAESGDPKAAVVEAVSPVLKTIYATAREAGAKVDMVVVLAAGIQIIAVLAKMLESQGLLTEDQIPAFCADVSKLAVAQHNAQAQSGMVGQPQGEAA